MDSLHKNRSKSRTLLTILYISIFYIGVAFVAYKFVTKDDIHDTSSPTSLQDILKEGATAEDPSYGAGNSNGSVGNSADTVAGNSGDSSSSSGSGGVSVPTQQQAKTQSNCTEQQGVPGGVCNALESAQANFTAENDIFVGEAQTAMAALPEGSVMIYKGANYSPTSDSAGTIKLDVSIPGVGQRRPEATLEQNGGSWLITKLQVN